MEAVTILVALVALVARLQAFLVQTIPVDLGLQVKEIMLETQLLTVTEE